MRLAPSNESDLPEIGAWVAADPWHNSLGDDFWLTGSNCFFAGKLQDDRGTVCYVKVREEDRGYRLDTQFAPAYQVSRSRVVKAAIKFFAVLGDLARANGKQYIIAESRSPSLIAFLERVGWRYGNGDNLKLEVTQNV